MAYILTSTGFKEKAFINKPKIEYDDIVDKSSYRQDSENIRNFISNGSGSSGEPLYDDPDNMPTNLEVSLRSGKFDKGEVSQMIMKKEKEVDQAKDNDIKKAENDKLEKINKARQEYLDKKTGFSGQPME